MNGDRDRLKQTGHRDAVVPAMPPLKRSALPTGEHPAAAIDAIVRMAAARADQRGPCRFAAWCALLDITCRWSRPGLQEIAGGLPRRPEN
jgi:hypothetical protein